MYDVSIYYRDKARQKSSIIDDMNLREGGMFWLSATGRNTDDPVRLLGSINALVDIAADKPVILPLYPRTRELIA